MSPSDLLTDLGRQNGTTLGRVLGSGKQGEAEEGSDGKMHATIRSPEDELVFEPHASDAEPLTRRRA